jgi:hypothetical protein
MVFTDVANKPDTSQKTGSATCSLEALFDIGQRLAVAVDNEAHVAAHCLPPSKVRQEIRRYWAFSAPFLGDLPAGDLKVDLALIEIDHRPSEAQDRLFAAARIETHQNEFGHVGPRLGRPARANQSSGFGAGKPSHLALWLRW